MPDYRSSTTSTEQMNQSQRMGWAMSRRGEADYFQIGDPLLKVWETEVEVEAEIVHDGKAFGEIAEATAAGGARAAAEKVYTILNIDHPDGWAHRSMTVGDVAVVGETAYFRDSIGFKMAEIHDSEVIAASQPVVDGPTRRQVPSERARRL